MGDPYKVLIENKDVRFLEIWKQMGLNENSPQEAKDEFWRMIDKSLDYQLLVGWQKTNFDKRFKFYTDVKQLAEAQRLRREYKDPAYKWLGYVSVKNPKDNIEPGEGLHQKQPPPQQQRPPSAVRLPPPQQQHWGQQPPVHPWGNYQRQQQEQHQQFQYVWHQQQPQPQPQPQQTNLGFNRIRERNFVNLGYY